MQQQLYPPQQQKQGPPSAPSYQGPPLQPLQQQPLPPVQAPHHAPPVQAPPPQYPNGQPFVVLLQPNSNGNSVSRSIAANYNAGLSMGLGCTQLIIGLLLAVLNIIGLVVQSNSSYSSNGFMFYIGHGIWCSIFFILSGAFGIGAAKTKNVCMVITFMVLSIVSAIMVFNVIGFSAAGIGEENSDSSSSYYYSRRSNRKGKLSIHSLMLILSIAEVFFAIWSSAICCYAACCCRNQIGTVHNSNPVHYNSGTQQMVIMPSAYGQQHAPQQQAMHQQAMHQGGSAMMYNNYTSIYPGGVMSMPGMPQLPTYTENPNTVVSAAHPSAALDQAHIGARPSAAPQAHAGPNAMATVS